MITSLTGLNSAPLEDVQNLCSELFGSESLATYLATHRPYPALCAAEAALEMGLSQLGYQEILEAINSHPPIGAESSGLNSHSRQEQLQAQQADDVSKNALKNIVELNEVYSDKFGYVFMICASGKSAHEIEMQLRQRLDHDENEEWSIAVNEWMEVNKLRLRKVLRGG